eukprot:Hpha_TRINITY_DN23062_c0_g1::TRINITY_DN23062_c0_g1_i1::g.109293::m.109293
MVAEGGDDWFAALFAQGGMSTPPPPPPPVAATPLTPQVEHGSEFTGTNDSIGRMLGAMVNLQQEILEQRRMHERTLAEERRTHAEQLERMMDMVRDSSTRTTSSSVVYAGKVDPPEAYNGDRAA